MASKQFDEFMKGAQTTGSTTEATFFAQLATAEALGRIADILEWTKEDCLKEEVLPCNEMGGEQDFLQHCSKPDRHDGPHSYEE